MRKIMPSRLVTGLAAIAAIVVIAGCSSDSKTSTATTASSSSNTTAAPVSLPGTTNDKGTGDATSGSIEIELDDYYFAPTFVKGAPGSKVTIKLKNESKTQHTFTSTALNVDQVVDPGKEAAVEVTLPGNLPTEFHCRFHQSLGMQGALFDTPGASASGGGTPAGSTASSSSSSSDTGYYN